MVCSPSPELPLLNVHRWAKSFFLLNFGWGNHHSLGAVRIDRLSDNRKDTTNRCPCLPSRRTRRTSVPQGRPSPGVGRATAAWKQTRHILAERVSSVGGEGDEEGRSGGEPFPSVVLSQNGHHPLHRAQDGSVDDHRPLLVVTVVAAEEGSWLSSPVTPPLSDRLD